MAFARRREKELGVERMNQNKVLEAPSEPTVYGLDRRVLLLEHMSKQTSRRLESIDGNLNRIVWLIIIAVVGGLLSLIINNGQSVL